MTCATADTAGISLLDGDVFSAGKPSPVCVRSCTGRTMPRRQEPVRGVHRA